MFNQFSWSLLGIGNFWSLCHLSVSCLLYYYHLFFFFCVTNYYHLHSLKHQKCILLPCWWIRNLVLPVWNPVVGRASISCEVQHPLPSSLVELWVEFTALWLQDWGPQFFAECWLEVALSSKDASHSQPVSHHGCQCEKVPVPKGSTAWVRPVPLVNSKSTDIQPPSTFDR